MHPAYRLLSTLIIWLAVVGITAMIFLSPAGASAIGRVEIVLGVLGILGAAAAVGTAVIWRETGHGAATPAHYERSARKIKGDAPGRVERLIDLLDEDEIVELETLLLARDDPTTATTRH